MYTFKELVSNGFTISFDGENFTVTKDSEVSRFANFEDAVADAASKLDAINNKTYEFTAVVRYNRGLGVEYKTLPCVEARNIEEAKSIAREMFERSVADPKVDIREVKVRPKLS